jgi:hypothetical protein
VVAGAAVVVLAFAGLPAGELRFLGDDWPVAQAVLGGVLLILGLVAILRVSQSRVKAVKLTPAEESFARRVRHDLEPPPLPVMPGAAAARSADPELERVTAELRRIDLDLKRANVMLGTGKLTREGYAAHVEELRAEKGQLEAERIRIERARGRGS